MVQSFYGTRYLLAPAMALDDKKAACFQAVLDSVHEKRDIPFIELGGRYPKYEFLCYAVERGGLLLRGANQPDVEVFEPQEGTDYYGNPTTAVYAANDGIWPIFFAIVNRQNPQLYCLWNACRWARTDGGDLLKVYAFALDQEAFAGPTFVQGTVYLLPSEGFRQVEGRHGLPTAECLCETSVRPLARLSISPDDFPFLDQVRPFDVQDLMTLHRVLAGLTRVVEHADGYTFSFDAQQTPEERIQQAKQFIQTFYPAYRLRLSGRDGDEIALRLRFPAGIIRFCKEELLEVAQAVHGDWAEVEQV